ncbi:MAG: calcium/sodium antiporter [Pseudomonadota bacterium]|nr:calcium/sodium antiporter [Pseudomonadota bacterium]MEC8518288.1 calcium/sodium antiporter [Pseudomonadota bacterium]
MLEAILLVLGGFVLLGGGGEGLVSGAVSLADRLKVPPLIIGLTVIAFGTSAPELTVSIQAAFQGQPDIAVGNIIGSNISNMLLVLGISALFQPIIVKGKELNRDGIFMLLVTFGFCFVAIYGDITRLVAVGMVGVIGLYTVYLYRLGSDEDANQEVSENPLASASVFVCLVILALGTIAVVWGADLLVKGAVLLATEFGVSEGVIGLTVVAIGTSLPELAISILAALRGHAALAVGNIVGSNIYNILLILGVTGLVHPIAIAPDFLLMDIWMLLGVSGLTVFLLSCQQGISRFFGGLFLATYIIYIIFLFGA